MSLGAKEARLARFFIHRRGSAASSRRPNGNQRTTEMMASSVLNAQHAVADESPWGAAERLEQRETMCTVVQFVLPREANDFINGRLVLAFCA